MRNERLRHENVNKNVNPSISLNKKLDSLVWKSCLDKPDPCTPTEIVAGLKFS